MRVLHVVAGMNRAGVETWLMHLLRRVDRDRFQMDFLVHTSQPCAYDDEIQVLGSRIISCPDVASPWSYGYTFKRILHQSGAYDIVHSHVHHFNGLVLRLAKQANIPIRIAHSHIDTSAVEAQASLKRRFYYTLAKQWINQYATAGLACSRDAKENLFGSAWNTDPRWQTLYCGIDLTPFQERVDAALVRSELGIPQDAFVIGHVGRLVEQKNHSFLLKIAAAVMQQEPRTHLLLVGEGPLQSAIQQQAAQLGLTDRMTFAGSRSDVPRLMQAMDVFVFPSLYEGLGLVLIEAQAVGLRCVLAETIPIEADVVHPLMQRLPLSHSPQQWAAVILSQRHAPSPIAAADALALVEASPFNIEHSLENLQIFYETQCLNQGLHLQELATFKQ